MDDEEGALADQPLDDADAAMLRLVREAYDASDPVPAGLVDRVHFALALEAMFEEVAAMTRTPMDALAVRGGSTTGRTETLTFSAERLTAMVTTTRSGAEGVRLDGWLAPPTLRRVVLRLQAGGEQEVTADEQGQFAFQGLDEGFAQLRFVDEDDPRNAVVTPVFEL
jgi:hypothetical protein